MNVHATKALPFESVVDDVSAGTNKVQKGDYLPAGLYPVVDQGQEFVGGFSNDEGYLVQGNGPWIVFGDHTRVLKYVDFPFCMGADGVKLLKPRSEHGIDTKYLFHFLTANEIPNAGYSRHYKFLKRLKIPLPQLNEQRRIAAALDKADALRRKRRRALDLLDSLTPSIFQEMFGSRIGKPPVNIRPNVPNLPKGWHWKRLTDVARLATGHTPDRKQPNYWNGDIPWLSLSDIRALDGKIAHSTKECVTEDGIENSSSVLLPEGTVCFSRTASVGFATVMGRPMGTSQDFVNWVCGPSLNCIYLLWALIVARNELLSLASGSTHRTIYFPTVEQFHVLVPPIALQNRFATLAGRTLDCGGKLGTTSLSELFSSLQSRAFSGQL
jgi:type I restriction enzyme, S subunit